MIRLIKGCNLYAPEFAGKKDILILNDTIYSISDDIDIKDTHFPFNIDIIDAKGKIAVPGLIDSHVHITGGGGEGGFDTRTPEINLTDITTAGVTTVVGCLGTDGVTRSMENLLAKANSLTEEGITAYIYTGCYRVPTVTITDSIMKDIICIDKVIGVGEIAVLDNRSSQPSIAELKRLVADSRVAGMLSGKCGIINFHVGNGKDMLSPIIEIIKETEIPYSQFLPTHINRNPDLLKDGIKYALSGGYIDFTTSSTNSKDDTSVDASKAFKIALDAGVNEDNITFTSDGQGSLPQFDSSGNYTGLGIGRVSSLFNEFKDSIFNEKISVSKALKPVTSNPARLLKLKKKGKISADMDADIVLIDKQSFKIDTVIAKGNILVKNGLPAVYGTFEPSKNNNIHNKVASGSSQQ